MFKAPFSFKGRIRRLEFGLSYLLYWLVLLLIETIADYNNSTSILNLLIIPVIWFLLAQGAKRCHDRGNSGWYLFIPFYIFWMIFAEGEEGENEFGLNPKGIGNPSEIEDIGKADIE